MRILTTILLGIGLLFLAPLTHAQGQGQFSSGGGAGAIITTVAGLASHDVKGTVASVTDGASATDCVTGGGTAAVTCLYSGTVWAAVGSGGGSFSPSSLSGMTAGTVISTLDTGAPSITPSANLWTFSEPISVAGAISQSTNAIGSGGSTQTISPTSDFQTITLTANLAISFTQPTSTNTVVRLMITQAASGGPYTVTWTSVKWPGGVAPVMSTGASAVDWYSCELNGTTTYCTAGQDFK